MQGRISKIVEPYLKADFEPEKTPEIFRQILARNKEDLSNYDFVVSLMIVLLARIESEAQTNSEKKANNTLFQSLDYFAVGFRLDAVCARYLPKEFKMDLQGNNPPDARMKLLIEFLKSTPNNVSISAMAKQGTCFQAMLAQIFTLFPGYLPQLSSTLQRNLFPEFFASKNKKTEAKSSSVKDEKKSEMTFNEVLWQENLNLIFLAKLEFSESDLGDDFSKKTTDKKGEAFVDKKQEPKAKKNILRETAELLSICPAKFEELFQVVFKKIHVHAVCSTNDVLKQHLPAGTVPSNTDAEIWKIYQKTFQETGFQFKDLTNLKNRTLGALKCAFGVIRIAADLLPETFEFEDIVKKLLSLLNLKERSNMLDYFEDVVQALLHIILKSNHSNKIFKLILDQQDICLAKDGKSIPMGELHFHMIYLALKKAISNSPVPKNEKIFIILGDMAILVPSYQEQITNLLLEIAWDNLMKDGEFFVHEASMRALVRIFPEVNLDQQVQILKVVRIIKEEDGMFVELDGKTPSITIESFRDAILEKQWQLQVEKTLRDSVSTSDKKSSEQKSESQMKIANTQGPTDLKDELPTKKQTDNFSSSNTSPTSNDDGMFSGLTGGFLNKRLR